jgi:transposase
MIKFKVTLTAEERHSLERIVSTGKRAARKVVHARVLLLADEGKFGPGETNLDIAEQLEIGERTIERIRKRFVTESLESALVPRPQPPRPDKIKIQGSIEKQLIELACSDPPKGRSQWTLHLLANQLVTLGLVDSVSKESIRKVLKKRISTYPA